MHSLQYMQVAASFVEWNRIFLTLESALPLLDHCELFIRQEHR
jgi:hypothetical protein